MVPRESTEKLEFEERELHREGDDEAEEVEKGEADLLGKGNCSSIEVIHVVGFDVS